MVYKRIKRGGKASESGAAPRGGPNDKNQFKRGKIGEATAKRMQDKLSKLKSNKRSGRGAAGKDDDEEIASNDSDAFIDREPTNARNAKKNELLNDPFL